MALDHCVGAKGCEEYLKSGLYRTYGNMSSHSSLAMNLSRFGGIGLALCSAAITIVAKVATIAEAIIKGLCNLIIGVFKCNSDRICMGLKQLTVTFIVASLDLVIKAPLHIVIGAIVTIFATIKNPSGYAKSKANFHKYQERVLEKIIETKPLFRIVNENDNLHKQANMTLYA